MNTDVISITGKASIKLIDKNKVIKQELNIDNLVTSVGLQSVLARGRDGDFAGGPPSHIAFGRGFSIYNVNASKKNMTFLVSEISGSRYPISIVANTNVFTYMTLKEVGSGENDVNGIYLDSDALIAQGLMDQNIGEIGIFNATSSGILFARLNTIDFLTGQKIQIREGDDLSITWRWDI